MRSRTDVTYVKGPHPGAGVRPVESLPSGAG